MLKNLVDSEVSSPQQRSVDLGDLDPGVDDVSRSSLSLLLSQFRETHVNPATESENRFVKIENIFLFLTLRAMFASSNKTTIFIASTTNLSYVKCKI